MKKILFAIALAVVAIACNNNEAIPTGEGFININATTRGEVADPSSANTTKITRYLPQPESLSVKIEGENFLREWSSLREFNAEEELRFKSAPYTISLASDGTVKNGYGAAYFEGKAEVQVPDYDQTVKANIEVVLANSVVAITTTEQFRGYFPSYTFSVKGIEYDFESGDHLFIEAGETEIVCEATRQADLSNGKKTTLKKSILLRPTTRHILQFDLSTAGNVEVNISFDGEIVETIVLDVELNDKA
jgi:hypothetical protein